MRLDLVPAFLSLVFALTLVAYAQPAETPPTPFPAWNDNSLIAVQKSGGDPARPGNVKIEFYGHDAFKITSPAGLTLLADPWRNDPIGAFPKWFLHEFPAIPVGIVLSTHDHDAVDRPKALVILEHLVGQFKLGDIEVTGLADKHQCDPALDQKNASAGVHAPTCPPNNAMEFDNAIQIIKTGGLRIVVWGDNRGVPDPSLDHYLRNVDVLILPVETVLTPAEVDAIERKYDPKAIIPAHYFLNGLTTSVAGLESADGWVNDQRKLPHADVRRLDHPDLTLNPADLKGSRHRIYYFGDHFENQ